SSICRPWVFIERKNCSTTQGQILCGLHQRPSSRINSRPENHSANYQGIVPTLPESKCRAKMCRSPSPLVGRGWGVVRGGTALPHPPPPPHTGGGDVAEPATA